MRDEHLESSHQEAKSQAESLPSNPDLDELQPLFFDLIRLDKVEAVKSILNHFSQLKETVKAELRNLVASSGSASMAQVLCDDQINHGEGLRFWAVSIESLNFETFRWFISGSDMTMAIQSVPLSKVLKAFVKSGSLEMFRECEKFLIHIILSFSENIKNVIPSAGTETFFSEDVIGATDGYLDREHLLLSIWAALKSRNATAFSSLVILGGALGNVAKTTYSLVLAKALLEYGAQIDFRRSSYYLTPLHHTARQASPQAAELLKFLLYHGADPEPQSRRAKLKISEEKGPRNIAKWVGMSWDELIQKIKLDRERGFCPPEYR